MKILTTLLFLLAVAGAAAQSKTKQKEKAPTQKEMESAWQEAQSMMDEAMKEMSDEDRKLMDSLGVTMPDMKKVKVPKATDQQLAAAWEDEQRIVPRRDAARIAAIPKLTAAGLPPYIVSLQKKSTSLLSADAIAVGEQAFAYGRQKGNTPAQVGTMAAGFWAAGKADIALYLLGRACAEAPTHTDNLSNYAALMTMRGGQHLAVPILQSLSKKYKKNTTLLNNLGQAWFGLGEIVKAEKYLDSAIALYPNHPQANLTKSRIEESKGHTAQAVQCLRKSMQHAYSKEKEDRLRKLGYKIKLSDVTFSFKPDIDPLGLGRYKRPDYPTTIDQLRALAPAWDAFNNALESQRARLQKELQQQTVRHTENVNTMVAQTMQAVKSGSGAPGFIRPPLFSVKAGLVLKDLQEHQQEVQKKLTQKYLALKADLGKIEKERKRVDPSAPCYVHRDAFNDYLKKYNDRKKVYDEEVLKARSLYYGDLVFWSQYTSTDQSMYEIIRLEYLIDWLGLLSERLYQPLLSSPTYYQDCSEKKDGKAGKLGEFDNSDACKYKSTMTFGPLTLRTNCSHSTYELSFDNIPVGPAKELNYRYTEVGVQYESSTLKLVTQSLGLDAEAGPLKAELGVGSKWTVEMDPTGVTDWKAVISPRAELGVGISNGSVKAGASISSGADIEVDPSGVTDVNLVTNIGAGVGIDADKVSAALEIGVQSRVSIITGQSSVTGTGLLSNVTF